MKSNRKYHFTVEGETERWYLLWLQKQINKETAAKFTVTLDCPIQKNPLKRAKYPKPAQDVLKTLLGHLRNR